MTEPYIWQVLLNTDDRSRSHRAQVTEAALVATRPLVEPPGPGYVPDLGATVRSERRGRALLMVIDDPQGACSRLGVAPRGRESAALWRTLHATGIAALDADPATPPDPPWCGLVLADRMRQMPRPVTMAHVVLARVAAWAWIERIG